jgi:predicted amidohydrolase
LVDVSLGGKVALVTGNLATGLDLIGELGQRRCDLILLPELWPSGYSPASLAGDIARSAEPLDGPRTALVMPDGLDR